MMAGQRGCNEPMTDTVTSVTRCAGGAHVTIVFTDDKGVKRSQALLWDDLIADKSLGDVYRSHLVDAHAKIEVAIRDAIKALPDKTDFVAVAAAVETAEVKP